MAKLKIYTPDGEAVLIEAVDAREYVAHGGYTYEPKAEKPAEADDEADKGQAKAAGKKVDKASSKNTTEAGDTGASKKAPGSDVKEPGGG